MNSHLPQQEAPNSNRVSVKPFVSLLPVFNEASSRNIENVALIYNNREELKARIAEVVSAAVDQAASRPFGQIITNDSKVLMKPNWVLDSQSSEDAICLATHADFILAALELILLERPASVVIGDSPLQLCDWEKLHSPEFFEQVRVLSEQYNVPVAIRDFRRVHWDPAKNKVDLDCRNENEYIFFDLGAESELEDVADKPNSFRVTSYDPRRLAESHGKGMHKYCVAKELLEADVVISLPKVKTHQKTGLTACLKNFVGINCDKDFLPHHRVGGAEAGGDCYPGRNPLRRFSEWLLDIGNRYRGRWPWRMWIYGAKACWLLSGPQSPRHHLAAAWHGNDTCWRMVLDLNTIVQYGTVNGVVATTPQRAVYSLCDGIVGGEGDGPLKPSPLPLGIISFSNDAVRTDAVWASLMGLDIQKISLIRSGLKKWPENEWTLLLSGEEIAMADLTHLRLNATPAPGWIGHVELAECSVPDF